MTLKSCFYPLIGDKIFGWPGDLIDTLSGNNNKQLSLKVLTHNSFFSEYVFTPLKDPKNNMYKKNSKNKTMKNDFENRAEVSPMSNGCFFFNF